MSESLSGPMLAPKSGTAKQLVVLLHGYGSDGNDLISLGQYWQAAMPDAMFVAPNAHQACPMNPAGYQWFALEMDREMSRLTGSLQARPVVMDFLKSLWKQTGLGAEQTFITGFSQGGMMALDAGLRLEHSPLGIISFSGGLIGPEDGMAGVTNRPPVCLIHGEADDVVPVSLSKNSVPVLKKHNIRTALHLDPGSGHTITVEGLGFALAFMREVVAGKNPAS